MVRSAISGIVKQSGKEVSAGGCYINELGPDDDNGQEHWLRIAVMRNGLWFKLKLRFGQSSHLSELPYSADPVTENHRDPRCAQWPTHHWHELPNLQPKVLRGPISLHSAQKIGSLCEHETCVTKLRESAANDFDESAN